MTAAEKDERDHRVASQNREDLSSLLELRDIVDELGTIMKLLEEQTTTVKIMAEYFEEKGYGRSFIESALSRLDQYRTQVSDMKENAYAAQRAVSNPEPCPRLHIMISVQGGNSPRPEAKTSKCRRVTPGSLGSRGDPKSIAVCDGLHYLHCDVGTQTIHACNLPHRHLIDSYHCLFSPPYSGSMFANGAANRQI